MQVYYYNSVTNESSWTKPAGFSGYIQDTKPTSQLRVPGTNWYEIHCEDGRKYYYNDVSEVMPAREYRSRELLPSLSGWHRHTFSPAISSQIRRNCQDCAPQDISNTLPQHKQRCSLQSMHHGLSRFCRCQGQLALNTHHLIAVFD